MPQPTVIKTKDHDDIRTWISDRNGVPARIAYNSTARQKDPLTVWFRNEKKDVDQSYQELDWEEFFAIFDHYNFTFQYEENGDDRYCAFVKTN